MKRFFPKNDYSDLPVEEAQFQIATEMLDAARVCKDGIPAEIINPTLHAQAIKLGIDALLKAVRENARLRKSAARGETGGK